jgi:hypothetical protein
MASSTPKAGRAMVSIACRVLPLLLPVALTAACAGHTLDAGGATDSGVEPGDAGEPSDGGSTTPVPLPTPTPGSCSALTWGKIVSPVSDNDCTRLVAGRWTFCADDAGPPVDDSGFPYLVPQPAGLELVEENGALRFYILEPGTDGGLARSQAPNLRGTAVQPGALGSACRFWMAPDSNPGSQSGWTFERYLGPDALLVNGGASYVPAP